MAGYSCELRVAKGFVELKYSHYGRSQFGRTNLAEKFGCENQLGKTQNSNWQNKKFK
jgi:hypothetical protein